MNFSSDEADLLVDVPKKCGHCGLSKPRTEFRRDKRTKDGLTCYCIACCREYSRNSAHKYRHERRPVQKAWAEMNQDKVRRRGRKHHLKVKFGTTIEEMEAMLFRQAGLCAICGGDITYEPHVDHCHETGIIRGLLCLKCNAGIGFLGDDPAICDAAAKYLRSFAQRMTVA